MWCLNRFRELWAFWGLCICGNRWSLKHHQVRKRDRSKGGARPMPWHTQTCPAVMTVSHFRATKVLPYPVSLGSCGKCVEPRGERLLVSIGVQSLPGESLQGLHRGLNHLHIQHSSTSPQSPACWWPHRVMRVVTGGCRRPRSKTNSSYFPKVSFALSCTQGPAAWAELH